MAREGALGRVASRSDDGEGTYGVAIKYRSSQQQFSRALGHNANFVWNQYETCGADFVRK